MRANRASQSHKQSQNLSLTRMSTPTELRETAKQYRLTAQAIYDREAKKHYGEGERLSLLVEAVNMLYEATRRELYARMLEGREEGLRQCIERNKGESERAKERTRAASSKKDGASSKKDGAIYSVKDVRGRYKLFSTPYAERKEERDIARYQKKQRAEEREKKREVFKEPQGQFSFKL